jgi:hypothetical protein
MTKDTDASDAKFVVQENQSDDKLIALRAGIIAGEESGPSTRFDVEAFLSGKRDEWIDDGPPIELPKMSGVPSRARSRQLKRVIRKSGRR